MTQNVKDLVVDTVNAFVQDGQMFTAYDVTKHVRSQTSENVRHYEVQSAVHAEMATLVSTGGYDRVLHNFTNNGGATVQAIVYFPIGEDFNQYNPDEVKQANSAAPVAVATVPTTATVTTVVSPVAPVQPSGLSPAQVHITMTKDKGGRVCIPKTLVQQLGVKPGDEVFLHESSSQGLLLITKEEWKHPLLGKLRVDRDSNVRVTPFYLRAVKYTGSSFKVRGTSDHIVVEM